MSVSTMEKPVELRLVRRDVYQPHLKPRADNWEAAMAQLFSKKRIKWLYEPHEFDLSRSKDGHINFAFRPDFWLPDLGLYIEVTGRDRGLEGKHRQECVSALGKKHHRIRETQRIHGEKVLLFISSTCRRAISTPRYLEERLRRELAT